MLYSIIRECNSLSAPNHLGPVGFFFPIFNLDQNDPDLDILNQVIHFTSVTVFQSNIGLDPLDPDSNFQNFKMGLVYISQCSLGLLA